MTPEDWKALIHLAIRRHRVGPEMAAASDGLGILDIMPQSERAFLQAHIRENAILALRQMAETRRLTDLLHQADVTPIPLKGWVLSERLFGNATTRHVGDLDLLIPPTHISASLEALGAAGYAPAPDQHHLAALAHNRVLSEEYKDITLFHQKQGPVELHWKPLPFQGWPNPFAIPDPVHCLESKTGKLHCPSDQANMLYLPMHGMLHLWYRLKWLSDIAALARLRGADGLAEDRALALRMGLARPLDLALHLAAQLFGSPLPGGAKTMDRAVARAMRRCLAEIARDPTDTSTKKFQIALRLTAWQMMPRLKFGWAMVRYATLRHLRTHLAKWG